MRFNVIKACQCGDGQPINHSAIIFTAIKPPAEHCDRAYARSPGRDSLNTAQPINTEWRILIALLMTTVGDAAAAFSIKDGQSLFTRRLMRGEYNAMSLGKMGKSACFIVARLRRRR